MKKRLTGIRRIAVYAVSLAALSLVFMYGFFTVYENSYNMMHSEPIEAFDISLDGGLTVTVMDKKYVFFAADN